MLPFVIGPEKSAPDSDPQGIQPKTALSPVGTDPTSPLVFSAQELSKPQRNSSLLLNSLTEPFFAGEAVRDSVYNPQGNMILQGQVTLKGHLP